MRVLVTGGAGFIGANVATGLAARHGDWELIALDNLHRRGSELNVERLREGSIRFVRGDVRSPEELRSVGEIDALVECSAEPSVLAGLDGSPDYVVGTNLTGAYNCLELARQRNAYFVFLSSSRVYPVAGLAGLSLLESPTRFELADEQALAGASAAGISEAFPMTGPRTLYGTTKLAVELLIEEYRAAYGLRAVVDRCGVIAGPWQMGRVDQGVFAYWLLAHHFGWPLAYIGYHGSGKQVRDLLHVDDLVALVEEQLLDQLRWDGVVANVGGGRECSLSLLETTALCEQITGKRCAIEGVAAPRPGDVPVYISDCSRLYELTDWRPRRTPREILVDIHVWVQAHEVPLRRSLAGAAEPVSG
jgi:CDP-paratose 2-epimerase